MNTRTLGNLYDQLTPDERFRLALQAAARDDEVEARQLRQTCPRRPYVMHDAEFDERMELAWDIVRGVYILLLREAQRIDCYEIATNLVDCERQTALLRVRQAWEAGSDNGTCAQGDKGAAFHEYCKEVDAKFGIPPGGLDEILAEHRRGAAAMAEGFARFCRVEWGVELEEAFAAVMPADMFDWIRPATEVRSTDALVESDAETFERICRDMWRQRLELRCI